MNTSNHKQFASSSRARQSQAGLTLVELLIALALSGILISGALKIVESNKATLVLINSFTEAQETGRFSLEVLSRDIRMAGYSGCANDITRITSMLDETDTGTDGYDPEKHSFSNTMTAIDSSLSTASYGGVTPVTGSDVFITRGAVATDLVVSKTETSINSANIKLYGPEPQIDMVVAGITEGLVLMVTDCSTGHIFAVSNDPHSKDGKKLTVVHNKNVTGGPNNVDSGFGVAYPSGSSVLMMSAVTYFIAESSLSSTSNSLYRYSTLEGGAAVELVPFIEDVIFTYGVDVDNDYSADRYVTATELNNLAYTLAYNAAYAETYDAQITLGNGSTIAEAAADAAGIAAGDAAAATSTIDEFVVSVRFEVISVGQKDVGAAALTGYTDDGKLRKRFTRVVQVRNAGIGNI